LKVIEDISDRLCVEEALLRQALTFENIYDGVIVTDLKGCILDWNPAAERMFGYAKSEVLGKTHRILHRPEEATTLTKEIIEGITLQRRWSGEMYFIRKDGSEGICETVVLPLHDEQDKLIATIGVHHDITDRKRSEKALRQSEARLRLALEAAHMGTWDWDILTNKVAYSDQLGAVFGLPAGSNHPTYETFLNCVHPEDHEYVAQAVARAIGEGADFRIEFRVIWPDGSLHWVGNKGHVYRNKTGKPIRMVGVAMDITPAKQAEAALRQAEERYRSIFENTVEGLFQMTPGGHYLSANPGLARIYGYNYPEELIANITNINQQLYVDDQRWAEFLALMQADEKVSNFESQVYRKDGSVIWISENAHVVRDVKGELLYYEGSVVDITKRKVWEEALRYEQERTEQLLLNILPSPIAHRLKLAESTIADSFAEVTVLFADLVKFTELSAQIPPTELVELLNKIFSVFDQLTEKHGIEKIKTIGDAYMVVGGLPTARPDHAEAIAQMALDMQQEITRFKRHDGEPFQLRIGIHTGPVVAGVIGTKKFSYDLWGDTVNVASRMESQGVAGRIQVTPATKERLKDKYCFKRRGVILVKGKGEMITYWLTGKKVCKL